MEGDGEDRGLGLVERLGSGGFGDVGRDSGWDNDVTASFDIVSSGLAVAVKGFSKVDRVSTIGLSGPVISPSVDIRCMIGAGSGSGTERALPVRAADFGGTIGLGFDGPATAPPPNLSFIADTEIGSSTSFLSIACSGSPPASLVPTGPGVNPFVSDVIGGLEEVKLTGGTGVSVGAIPDFPRNVCVASGVGTSVAIAAEAAGGRDTGFPAFGPTPGFELALPAASDSKRDLSDAIDTGASVSSIGSLACFELLGCPEEGRVGGAIFREAGSSLPVRKRARNGVPERFDDCSICPQPADYCWAFREMLR